MRTRRSVSVVLALVAAASLFIAGCAIFRPDRAIDVASGYTSQLICMGTFVSGLHPAQVYADTVAPTPGIDLLDPLIRYRVDRKRREVSTTVAAAFDSRAVYRDGLGCLLVRGAAPADQPLPEDLLVEHRPSPPLLPAIAGPAVVEPSDERLRNVLDQAFAEPAHPPYHWTKVVVVMKDGQVVAERYAPGYGIETPLHGWSATKSVTSALIGILVCEGRLSVDEPAPVPAWSDRSDPRHAITIDELLRQTSGIALDETNSGFDPSTRMQFIERDMAGFAQSVGLEAPPGQRWAYTDGNYILLSRVIRDAVGGHAADVLRFARRELFEPLGMRNVTLQFDATGTPVGAIYLLATARDWARFGLLYLNDGMVGGRRILPEGWVRYSSSQTLATGYGAGFWTNLVDGDVPEWGVPWGMPHAPRDTFFARGAMGQYVVVIPSEGLVITRFGLSHVRGDDIEYMDHFVAAVVAALHERSAAAGRENADAAPNHGTARRKPALTATTAAPRPSCGG
jgi:CubicO group peptidase (beta-lactamase class C family)